MHRLSTSFVLGYHGCDATVAEQLLAGAAFKHSTNIYDWLGHGIYFWEGNPRRGLEFAKEAMSRNSNITKPAVIGAVIDLGLCLDLTTSLGIANVRTAYEAYIVIVGRSGNPPPKNSGDLLRRQLDCAVIQCLHDVRDDMKEPPIDSVKGLFLEGKPIYETAGFHEKTHIQICVRKAENIKGVFRVPAAALT